MFITFEQQERTKAFDRLVSETAQVLAEPIVARRLGGMAVRLRQRLELAVLPNYRFNTLSLPHEYAGTECFSVMPVQEPEEEKEFMLDPSVVLPTPRRSAFITEHMAMRGKTDSEAHAFVVRTTAAVSSKRVPALRPTSLARCDTYRKSDTDTNALYVSRPIVLSRVSETDSILGIGSRMAHELTHVLQREAMTEEPEDIPATLVSGELEAYRTEHDIIMALTAHPLFDTDMTLSTTSLVVEGFRRKNTHPDRPYEATPVIMQKMREYRLLDHRSTGVADWQ
jgi:hypothetical protein